MNLRVRFSVTDPQLTDAVARAMDFWASQLDMEWHQVAGNDCSIHVVFGDRERFRRAEAARAQLPDRPGFQGWVAFNPKISLTADEQYTVAVHEVGHLLGLPHNPSSRSIMFFICLGDSVFLDRSDLSILRARHRLRSSPPEPVSDE